MNYPNQQVFPLLFQVLFLRLALLSALLHFRAVIQRKVQVLNLPHPQLPYRLNIHLLNPPHYPLLTLLFVQPHSQLLALAVPPRLSPLFIPQLSLRQPLLLFQPSFQPPLFRLNQVRSLQHPRLLNLRQTPLLYLVALPVGPPKRFPPTSLLLFLLLYLLSPPVHNLHPHQALQAVFTPLLPLLLLRLMFPLLAHLSLCPLRLLRS